MTAECVLVIYLWGLTRVFHRRDSRQKDGGTVILLAPFKLPFAKGVNRDDIIKGAEELGVPLEEHIAFCIAALREKADALGLRGNAPAAAQNA